MWRCYRAKSRDCQLRGAPRMVPTWTCIPLCCIQQLSLRRARCAFFEPYSKGKTVETHLSAMPSIEQLNRFAPRESMFFRAPRDPRSIISCQALHRLASSTLATLSISYKLAVDPKRKASPVSPAPEVVCVFACRLYGAAQRCRSGLHARITVDTMFGHLLSPHKPQNMTFFS